MKIRTEILLAATAATMVQAQYDSYFFSTSATNWECPDFGYQCQHPFACSHDSTIDKYYCCIPGSTSNVCWTGDTQCSGRNGTAGTGQLECDDFCCLDNREICTQRTGQINICWATVTNPFVNVSDARMNQTYSSLAAANPTATQLPFQLAQVTSSASAQSITSPASTPESPASDESSSSSLSGGAIAGIVVGAVIGALLVLGAAFFFWKRNGRQSRSMNPNQQPQNHEYYGNEVKQQQQQHPYGIVGAAEQEQQQKIQQQYYQPQPVPQEMDAGPQNWNELESDTSGGRSAAHELAGDQGM